MRRKVAILRCVRWRFRVIKRYWSIVRIVSLCPSITETLIDLGLSRQIVGVTRFCIHPAEVVKGIPKVGGTKNPDLAAIDAAAPDLVFVNAEENRREDYEVLASKYTVDVSMPRNVAEVPQQLRRFGMRLGRSDAAEARAAELEDALAALERRSKPSFSYAYLVWKKPWMAVGPDTYVSDLLSRAGGRNVFGDSADRYPEITVEALAAKKPELVLLPDEPYPFDETHRGDLANLLDARIELVSGDDCCWHGVRSIRGVRLMMDLVDSM
jgi:ABC-type Fe3+-hydroxamate transport system substrate-binding protein